MYKSFLETWHKRGGKEKGRQDNAKKILLWQSICLREWTPLLVDLCVQTKEQLAKDLTFRALRTFTTTSKSHEGLFW